tara:strand:- start:121 stop:345 length:225 start_codon:yes stop_codon:yes gene_type:complete
MREQDELLDKVQKAIVNDRVNGLDIYCTYETFDEIAHIEVYKINKGRVIDCYTNERMTVEIISKDYPQFFSTNK